MCGVSSTLFSYLRSISDARVSYIAYQWRMCYVRIAAVEYVWRIRSIRNILWRSNLSTLGMTYTEHWRSKRILMLLYNCFRSSEVMDQMFLTVLGSVQGLLKSTLGVASVFDHVVLRPG